MLQIFLSKHIQTIENFLFILGISRSVFSYHHYARYYGSHKNNTLYYLDRGEKGKFKKEYVIIFSVRSQSDITSCVVPIELFYLLNIIASSKYIHSSAITVNISNPLFQLRKTITLNLITDLEVVIGWRGRAI